MYQPWIVYPRRQHEVGHIKKLSSISKLNFAACPNYTDTCILAQRCPDIRIAVYNAMQAHAVDRYCVDESAKICLKPRKCKEDTSLSYRTIISYARFSFLYGYIERRTRSGDIELCDCTRIRNIQY